MLQFLYTYNDSKQNMPQGQGQMLYSGWRSCAGKAPTQLLYLAHGPVLKDDPVHKILTPPRGSLRKFIW